MDPEGSGLISNNPSLDLEYNDIIWRWGKWEVGLLVGSLGSGPLHTVIPGFCDVTLLGLPLCHDVLSYHRPRNLEPSDHELGQPEPM